MLTNLHVSCLNCYLGFGLCFCSFSVDKEVFVPLNPKPCGLRFRVQGPAHGPGALFGAC